MMSDEGEDPLVSSRKSSNNKVKREKLASSIGRDDKAFAEENALVNDTLNIAGANGLDDKASAEETAVYNGILEEQARKNNHKRQEKVRDSFAAAFVCGFWLLFGLACIAVIVWDWHLVCPKNWCWLDNSQLEKLAQIMQFAYGAFAGSVATYARQFIKTAPKSHAPQ